MRSPRGLELGFLLQKLKLTSGSTLCDLYGAVQVLRSSNPQHLLGTCGSPHVISAPIEAPEILRYDDNYSFFCNNKFY
jgi:hypothetical protein